MQATSSASRIAPRELRSERITQDGLSVEYRLYRAEAYSLSVTCNARGVTEYEELTDFTRKEVVALAFFHLAVRELILPHTLADIWRELTDG